jgi:hypothetical protein
MTPSEVKPRFWLRPAGVARARLRRVASFGVVIAAAVSLVLAVGVSRASATVVVGAAPTWPIPANAPAGPPTIPVATLVRRSSGRGEWRRSSRSDRPGDSGVADEATGPSRCSARVRVIARRCRRVLSG